MTGRKLYIYALIAAILPAIAITIPTSQAQAKDGRNAAFIAGLVAGAVGGAILYDQSNKTRWNRVQNHYHRNGFRGCHTHNGVYHCHNAKPRRVAPPPPPPFVAPSRTAPPRSYGRPEPWTRAWYNYCHQKYRSFNPRTGYFTTYSGQKRFCR